MSELYISDMILRESRPRSKRLLGLSYSGKSQRTSSRVIVDSAFDECFEKVTIGEDSDGNPIYAIKAKYAFYSVGQVSAYGISAGGGEGTGVDWIQYSEQGVGTHIADIVIAGQTQEVWAPSGGAGLLSQLGDVQLSEPSNYHVPYYFQGKWRNMSFAALCTQQGLLSEYSDAVIRGNWTFSQNRALQFYDSAGHCQIYGQQTSAGFTLNLYGYDAINLLTKSGGKIYANGIEITGDGGGGGGYTLPVASAASLGGIKIGYSTSGKNVGLQLDSSSDKAYVELTSDAIVAALGYTPAGGSTVEWDQYVTAGQGVQIAQITINGVATGVYAPASGGGYTLPVASDRVRGGIKVGFEDKFNFLGVRVSGENAYVQLTSTAITTALGFTPVGAATLNNYLPLAGGTMTGDIVPDSAAVNLGSSAKAWGSIYANRWYPNVNDSTHYIEYTSNGFTIHGNIIASGSVAAGA